MSNQIFLFLSRNFGRTYYNQLALEEYERAENTLRNFCSSKEVADRLIRIAKKETYSTETTTEIINNIIRVLSAGVDISKSETLVDIDRAYKESLMEKWECDKQAFRKAGKFDYE